MKMSPFEALNGRQCNIPISWNNLLDRITLGPDMLKALEQKVAQIKKNLKMAQDRHKSYTDNKRTHKKFKVGDHVYIRIRPIRRSLRMETCAKMAPWFLDPLKVSTE